jgi:hypothetical protein
MAAMLDVFNQLSEREQEQHEYLHEAIAGLFEMRDLIRPSEEYDGQQALGLDELVEYTKRLEQARPLAEDIRMYWIADVLANTNSTCPGEPEC